MKKLLVLLGSLAIAGSSLAEQLSVNGERLNQSLADIREIGLAPSGGSIRTAFTPFNLQALDYVSNLLTNVGYSVSIDPAANLVAIKPGSDPELAPIMSGSHLDTVPNGGHYDGIVGSMAAVEVALTLADTELRHPLEIVIWANEEGGKTGSRAIYGNVAQKEMILPSLSGRSIGLGMKAMGGDPERLAEVERETGEIAAYVELHIEQGAELDREGLDIGVVQGIVGIKRWYIDAIGFANHAGTTPMSRRQDALLAASKFVVMVNEVITSTPGTQVGTVGKMDAKPGAPNVIPGQASFSLEIRDLSMEKIDQLFAGIEAGAKKIEAESNVRFSYQHYYTSPAAPANDSIMAIIEANTKNRGYSYQVMPSGAGHDAQSVAQIAPIGMIFVPSKNGVSHAPSEFTAPDQITKGANVLLDTILSLDQM